MTIPKSAFTAGDGRRHGPPPGTKYQSKRESRLAPLADMRSASGKAFLTLERAYRARMPAEPDLIQRDRLRQAILIRLALDALEKKQIETGHMDDARYFPLSCAHSKLMEELHITGKDGAATPDPPALK